LPDPLPEEVKEERRARFMKMQERISAQKLKAKIGSTVEVLVDAPGIGRSSADAPQIDGVVRFSGGNAGQFVNVLVERADAHDLYGRVQ
jgi:ribosomal protein S12 methylthiotransferase